MSGYRMAHVSEPRRAPIQREKVIQSHIAQLLRSLGAAVYVMGTRRRATDFQGTMQTPGIPDLMAFIPARLGMDNVPIPPRFLFVECKAAHGRMSPAQRAFQNHCANSDVPHVHGDLDAVIAWLVERRYVKAEQFAHYRQPSEGQP